MDNGYKYYRKCPLCGELQEISAPTMKPEPTIQPTKQPLRPTLDKVEEFNEQGGGVSASWGK